jgi:hypothetical protein
MRRNAAVLTLAVALVPLAAPAWGHAPTYTVTDSAARADVHVKVPHAHGQAINVTSVGVRPRPGLERLKVVWRLHDVTVRDATERLSLAWFDGPESVQARHGTVDVELVDGVVTATDGCSLTADAVRVKPKAGAVVVRLPYACFDTARHQARMLTITPLKASLSTLGGRRIATDNPLKSPGEPIQAGISVSLGR